MPSNIVFKKRMDFMLCVMCLTGVCFSSYCWVVDNFQITGYFKYIFVLSFIIYFSLCKIKITKDTNFIKILFVLVVLGIWTVLTKGVAEARSIVVSYAPVFFLYYLPKRSKRLVLEFITKWFGVITGIGIVVFLLVLSIDLPPLYDYTIPNNNFYASYSNYIFFVRSNTFVDFYRFNGIFREPGHLSILIAFLIYANRYEYKGNRYLIILTIALILTFSLAGWVLYVIGLIVININRLKTFVICISILASFFYISILYNDGDNVVNNLIISRFEYDEKKGIVGNNRFYGRTDTVFNQMLDTGEILIGTPEGVTRTATEGAGYKIYFINFGLISAILVALLYIELIPPKCNRIYALGFFMLIVLCFMQRAYPSWISWYLPYVIGIGLTVKNNVNSEYKKLK